jgi:hypothetical protein
MLFVRSSLVMSLTEQLGDEEEIFNMIHELILQSGAKIMPFVEQLWGRMLATAQRLVDTLRDTPEADNAAIAAVQVMRVLSSV